MKQRENQSCAKKRWKRTEWTRIKSINPRIELRKCFICGEYMRRRFYGTKYTKIGLQIYSYQHWETLRRYLTRKTCSKECKKQLQSGAGNPNYKGIMPRCINCGEKIAYKGEKGNWTRCLRCRKCFLKWAKETDYFRNTPQIKYIAERMRKMKGIYPEALKPFCFQKIYNRNDKCKIWGCNEKPHAKWLCKSHYNFYYWREVLCQKK